MAIPKSKYRASTPTWSAFARYRVHDVVVYIGVEYQNITGHNSTPSISNSDWNDLTSNQFTEDQKTRILALIYIDYIATISVSPTFGERGVSISHSLTYNIESKDDTITSASINQSIGSVLGNVDAGSQNIPGLSTEATITYTLTIGYTRNETPNNATHNATLTTYVPQFAGWSSLSDLTGSYTEVNTEANFQKYIQASTTINKTNFSPSGEYIWFVSNKNNAQILDGNGFSQSVGEWDNGSTEFYLKSLTLTLANGATTTVYIYRSRNVKTLSNFTYKIQ